MAGCHQLALVSLPSVNSGGNMDSSSRSDNLSSNCSHSSPLDSANNNTMQNGTASPSGDSEDAEDLESVDVGGVNRTSVSGAIPVGSVGNITVTSADTDNNANSGVTVQNDADVDKELEELAKLRCQSVATEVVAARYKRRCSDYPGFAFGSSIFSSNTMMKFSIIKNELHNIMNVQLKRVSMARVRRGVTSTLTIRCHTNYHFAFGIFPDVVLGLWHAASKELISGPSLIPAGDDDGGDSYKRV